jgi:hypothetical protein
VKNGNGTSEDALSKLVNKTNNQLERDSRSGLRSRVQNFYEIICSIRYKDRKSDSPCPWRRRKPQLNKVKIRLAEGKRE